MTDFFRPFLELTAAIPAAVLCCLPVKKHLPFSLGKTLGMLTLLLLVWAFWGGVFCCRFQISGRVWLFPWLAVFAFCFCRMTDLAWYKTLNLLIGVCGLFSCLANLAAAADAMIAPDNAGAWFTISGGIVLILLCWFLTGVLAYPALKGVSWLLEELDSVKVWQVFWVIPAAFTALNIYVLPQDYSTVYAGRIRVLYPVAICVFLGLLLLFDLMCYLMARGMEANIRLRQENQMLQMQALRYEGLHQSIDEVRQARHDLRHHFNTLSALAEKGKWEEIRSYVNQARKSVLDAELTFCKNSAADAVVGYYAELFRRENISFVCQMSLPEDLPVSEMSLCLVLSNLLENGLKASVTQPKDRRQVRLRVKVKEKNQVLIWADNLYENKGKEEKGDHGVFSKGQGMGLKSIRNIAEKSGGYCEVLAQEKIFQVRVLLQGK